MEATIKETVKNIFKSNTFEAALDLTRDLRGEYIKEFGAKSWNGLVTYYKNANIVPESIVAEEEAEYSSIAEESEEESEAVNEAATEDELDAIADEVAEIKSKEDDAESLPEEERIEYMLYRNTGEKVEWFGHRENFYNLEVGATARMIRMNNKGVSEGFVVASNALTLDEVALFHRCYAVIIRMKRSYKEQLELAAKCLMKLPNSIAGKYHMVPASDTKLTDYVLNYSK